MLLDGEPVEQEDAQQDGRRRRRHEHRLLDHERAEIGRCRWPLLLRADAHHRRQDQGLLQVAGEEDHHPGEGEAAELLHAQRAGEEEGGEEVAAADDDLVGEAPVDLAQAADELQAGGDHGRRAVARARPVPMPRRAA